MTKNDNIKWPECDPGTIRDLVERKEISRRREFLGKVSGMVTSAATVLTIGLVYVSSRNKLESRTPLIVTTAAGSASNSMAKTAANEMPLKTINCKQTLRNLPKYICGSLGCSTRKLVTEHLAKCPACNERHLLMISPAKESHGSIKA